MCRAAREITRKQTVICRAARERNNGNFDRYFWGSSMDTKTRYFASERINTCKKRPNSFVFITNN